MVLVDSAVSTRQLLAHMSYSQVLQMKLCHTKYRKPQCPCNVILYQALEQFTLYRNFQLQNQHSILLTEMLRTVVNVTVMTALNYDFRLKKGAGLN